ncbi:Transcription factor 25 [Bagarius yarrelli]|uniref:Transcription factor 25 n=1 Tax=Bagarius yarrelli TaxID=175774 RepID=A0A556V8G6_BAGYA|nr:Transcription factor 25 [Bagarius yarrelli]
MSSRALRRLKGKQRGQEDLNIHDLKLTDGEGKEAELEEEEDEERHEEEKEVEVLQPARNKSRKAKKKIQKNISNIYELIGEVADTDGNKTLSDEDAIPTAEPQEKLDSSERTNNKKKKKKKRKKAAAADVLEEPDKGDDIDALLENLEKANGVCVQTEDGGVSGHRPLLYVEHRNLNPETELKRYFGARAVLGDQRPRQRQRPLHRSTWMTSPKDTWPRFSRPGISMILLESTGGLHDFTFEHSRDYQQVQFKFLDAVESMDPNNIVALLQLNPYHIDSLLQLSDVCRIQEDQETARDLIGSSRLDYRRAENSYKSMPVNQSDPSNVVHRNLSQLPNFALSVALACYHEVTTQPVMSYDPLPPLDAVVSYSRPERENPRASNESTLSLLFRSLLPNFNLQGGQRAEDDLEVAHAGRELNQEVNRLMVAMRDMLANIQFQDPPRDNNQDRDEEEWD